MERVWLAPAGLLREDGFLERVEALVVGRPDKVPAFPNFAAEAGVGAVMEAGRRIGLVGDLV